MTDNATSSRSEPVKQPAAKADVNVDIEQNIMDGYDNPTYHFRLYMMSPEAVKARTFGNIDNRERVVIAESGVSAVDIDDVEIKTLGSISKEAGVGVATNFSFTLREPYGATLLDQLQKAGYYLGIRNFQKFPMFLELSFRGRRNAEDGLSDNSSDDHPLRGMVWTWPIQLTNMAMNVTVGGATYAIEAVAYSDHAYTNQTSDLEELSSIDAKTVGEFFTELQRKLNAVEEKKKTSTGYTVSDSYQFYIDDDIYKEPIVPLSKEELENRSASYNAKNGKMTFTFQAGTSIEKIVYNVLSLTKTFQNEIKGTDDPDSIGKAGGNEEAIYQKLWRIIADCNPTDYDAGRGDYGRSFKYLIIPYEMTTLQHPSNINAATDDQGRFDSHKSKGLIKKLYNYIYTGLNDQVFDFELNFNFNWFAALPIQGGLSTLASRQEPPAGVTQEQRQKTDLLSTKIDKGITSNLKTNAKDSTGYNPEEKQQEVNAVWSAYGNTIETVTNAVSAAQSTVTNAQAEFNTEINNLLTQGQNGIQGPSEFVAGIAEQLPNSPITNQVGIAGLTKGTKVSTSANRNTTDKAQRNLRSIDIQLDLIDFQEMAEQRIQTTLQTIKTPENDGQGYAASPGQTLLSAMFEQAQSPVSGDLVNIELRIKGDPYWLEPSPVRLGQPPTTQFRRLMANRKVNPDQVAQVDSSTFTEESEKERNEFAVANTAEQQTLIVFRSFTPLEFDPETGLTPAGKKSTNVLNGIYAVKEVTHSFSGGEFTQTLHGIRNVFINLQNVDLFGNITDQPEDTASDSTSSRTDILSITDATGAGSISPVDPTAPLNQTPINTGAIGNGGGLIDPNI